tara:strand:- start:1598 stop:1729 length:132 start_codon:yes stop_codon:yes gene_type:complete
MVIKNIIWVAGEVYKINKSHDFIMAIAGEVYINFYFRKFELGT